MVRQVFREWSTDTGKPRSTPISGARRANLAVCVDCVKSPDVDSLSLSFMVWLPVAPKQACGLITGLPNASKKFHPLVLAEWCVRNIQSRYRPRLVGRLKIDVKRFRDYLRRVIAAN